MKLPLIRRIRIDDIPESERNGWIAKLFFSIYGFMEKTYELLNRNITFSDNINSSVKTFRLSQNDLPFSFNNPLRNVPLGCLLVALKVDADNFSAINSAFSMEYYYNGDKDSIVINNLPGTSSGVFYNLTVIVLGG